MLLFENFVTQNRTAFVNKVISIAKENKIPDPNYLMFVMWFETAHTFSPSIENPKTHAVGLLQFMPDTARRLGTTTEALKKMSNVQQLDYVNRYLKPYRNILNSAIDLYFAVFFPVAINKGLNFVLQTNNLLASKIADQNPIFDINRDRQISVDEVQTSLFRGLPDSYLNILKKKVLVS